MSRTRIFEWHRRFREGRENVEDNSGSGRPKTSRTNVNVKHVREKVRSDRRLTVGMIANERVWSIIMKNQGIRKISAKMIPRLLNDEQKERRGQVCQDILKELETETVELLLVKSRGSSRTIHLLNGRALDRRVRRHQGPRKQG